MITPKLKTAAPALLAAATLFLTACGSDEQPTQATPPTTTAAAASSTPASSMAESSMTESSESTAESSTTESSESTESSISESTESTESSEASEPSTSASSAATSAGTSKQVVIKAFAGKAYPGKVGSWVKAPGSGPGSVYDKGDTDVVSSFLKDSDYASISTAVKTEKTPVSAGLCGGTGVEGSYTCYLKTTDGVINVAGDALDDVVEFSDELAKALGSS